MKKETLEDIIIASGIKKEIIAKRMGISPSYLWRLRQEPNKMDLDYMKKLSEAMGVELDRVIEAVKNN